MARDDVTWEEVSKHNLTDGSVWMVYENDVYDVSKFYDQHPGGQIIRIGAGRDVTGLVESHHSEAAMTKIIAILKNKCDLIGSIKKEEKAILHDKNFYTTVRQRVEAHLSKGGKTRHWNEMFASVELLVTVFAYFVSTYHTTVYASYWWALMLGVCVARGGFLMHMGNHGAASSSSFMCWLHGTCMDLIGSCSLVWMHEHQIAHHLTPNEFGSDNDCAIGAPYIRMHPELPAPQWWQKFQPVITAVGISGGFFKWYIGDPFCVLAGEVGVVKFYRDDKDIRKLAFWKGQWFILHVALPVYYHGLSFWNFFIPLLIFMVVGANYLEQIFVVNHIQDGLVPPRNVHWSHKQVLGSANWGSGCKISNFFSGGLNHQIEHHLFPSVSYYLYPEISPIVEQTCKEFGLKYVNFKNFPQAWIEFNKYLITLGTSAHIKHA